MIIKNRHHVPSFLYRMDFSLFKKICSILSRALFTTKDCFVLEQREKQVAFSNKSF
jgi:hypothetical protein